MLERRQFVIAGPPPPPPTTVDPHQFPHTSSSGCPSSCALVDDGHDRVTARISHHRVQPFAERSSDRIAPSRPFVRRQRIRGRRRVEVLPGLRLPGVQMSGFLSDHAPPFS